ncbi:unnamed protein product [Triticum turgidum subsp. durum]|uniref:SHSP domain-containing protein n=1 Tax=Triticum turgidum subsp. durum TaxID=4567 RepID=A0A9R0WP38_TRITD|nr:unnamed protein product [Triticum turgidum subsp. durum]
MMEKDSSGTPNLSLETTPSFLPMIPVLRPPYLCCSLYIKHTGQHRILQSRSFLINQTTNYNPSPRQIKTPARMLQAVVSNPQPVAASLGLGAPCRPGRGSVRVRSTRNGSADNLDHLRRPPTTTARQPRQGSGNPAPRRRVIQTTPFGLWDSFPDARTLDQMMRTMERIIDEADDDDGRRPFVVPAAPTARRADDTAAGYRRGRTPWEIKERAGDYLVRFDMPGMTREDVRVSVQDRTLVVVAEKAAKQGEADGEKDKDNEEDGEEEEAWPAASYGRYRTRVELPENVEVERIAAEVRDGVLYLSIPKVSPSGGKVVSIQVQ